MPRPSRVRVTHAIRSPKTAVFHDEVIEMYAHPDDMPQFPDAPKKRPRHATRGAAAAERRQDAVAAAQPLHSLPRRPSTRSLRPDTLPAKPLARPKDPLPHTLKHDSCTVCLRKGTEWMLLTCVRCARCVHSYCLNPPQTMLPSKAVWTCDPCMRDPPPKKKQAARIIKQVVDKYSVLVQHRYLDTMSDAIALATAAEVASAKQESHHKQHFGIARSVHSPESLDPAENTVVLKVDSEDSELEDLRPLADIQGDVQRQRPQDTAVRRLPLSSVTPSGYGTSSIDSLDSSEEDIQSLRSSPAVEHCKGTANGTRRTRADVLRTESTRRNEGVSRRTRASRPKRRGRLGEDGSSTPPKPKIFLKLRRRPPHSGSKERARQVMDEKAKAEMCKRLAKARAKKAELKEIARREKEEKLSKAVLEQTTGDTTNGKMSADTPVLAPKMENESWKEARIVVPVEGSLGSKNGATKGTNVAPGLPNSSAAVTQIAAMQGVVPSLKAASTRVNFVRENGGKGGGVSTNSGSRRQAGAAGSSRQSSEVQAPWCNRPLPEAQVGDVNSNRMDSHPRSDSTLVGAAHESPGNHKFYFNSGKPISSPVRGSKTENADLRSTRALASRSPASRKKYSRPESPALTENNISLKRGDDIALPFPNCSTRLPSNNPPGGKELNRAPVAKQYHRGDPMGHVRDVDTGLASPRVQTLQEHIALGRQPPPPISGPTQHSSRSTVYSPKPVTTNWNELKHDAKNEALFTLAKVQKGGIKKQRSGGKTSSGTLEASTATRAAKGHHRTNNVPESERKRIHLTAMVASGRARGSGTPMTVDPPGDAGHVAQPFDSAAPKSSINRLLIDPLPARYTTPQENPPGTEIYARSPGRAHTHLAQGITRSPTVNTHGNVMIPENGTSRHEQSHLRPQWDEQGEYEGLRVPSRASGIASSQSGSQSEHGSVAAGMPTPLHTLRKPRKRKTLALAAVGPTGNISNPMPARTEDTNDTVVAEQSSAAGGSVWGNASGASGGYRRHAHSQSSHEFEGQGGSMKSGYVEQTPDMNSRRSAELDRRSFGSSPPAFTLSQYPRHEIHASGRTGQGVSNREGARYLSPETDLSRGVMDDHYPSPNLSAGQRGDGAARNGIDVQMAHTQISPMRPVSQGTQKQGYPSPIIPGEYHPGPIDDNSRLGDARRLRRSAAPTVPTATRRYRYEQGRQLAKFTKPASPSEAQQSYSSGRRPRGPPRHTETAFAHAANYGADSKSDPRSFGQPSYPPYEDCDSNTHTLNHRAIAHGGMRPQLVPMVRSESPLRSQARDLNWSSHEFPRFGDAGQVPITQRYQSDYRTHKDDRGAPLAHYHAAVYPQGAAPNARQVYERSRDFAVAPMRGHDERVFPQSGASQMYGSGVDYGRSAGFSNQQQHALGMSSAGFEQSECVDGHRGVTQQTLPARTDPSLKNLLG